LVQQKLMANRTEIRQIEEQAALFALDALPTEEAGAFQQRLSSGCPLCEVLFEDCRQTVALLPLSVADVPPPPGLRKRLLERIGVSEPEPKPAPSALKVVRPQDTEWEQGPAPGVEFRRLLGRRTTLVRMSPGTAFPTHEHRHAEQCLVLEGDIISDGVTARAGDFTYMPAGSVHSSMYTENGCLLLIAYT
jgi:mannose-6-phosphate isomerase-like protein (cupin superfamily)